MDGGSMPETDVLLAETLDHTLHDPGTKVSLEKKKSKYLI